MLSMGRIFDDSLDMLRMEQGKFEFTREPFALASIIESLTLPKGSLDRAEVTFEVEPGARSSSLVRGDAFRLIQALTNVLNNARHSSSPPVNIATQHGDGNTRSLLSLYII